MDRLRDAVQRSVFTFSGRLRGHSTRCWFWIFVASASGAVLLVLLLGLHSVLVVEPDNSEVDSPTFV